MAYTQDDLTAIETAMKSGVRRVRLNGREQEYHSVDQMIKARDLIRSEINRVNSTIKRPRAFRARTGKGL